MAGSSVFLSLSAGFSLSERVITWGRDVPCYGLFWKLSAGGM